MGQEDKPSTFPDQGKRGTGPGQQGQEPQHQSEKGLQPIPDRKEDNEKELSSQTMQYFGLIENKVEKMDHLIGGILTYSKIDKIEIEKENVSTQQIIQNIINIIHIPTNVQVVIKGTLPVIQGDTYRIQQLFQNLIGNAVNYIEREFGLVKVSCQELQECHIFAVKDNGVGIAKETSRYITTTKILTSRFCL